MALTINGDAHPFEENQSVLKLLSHLQLEPNHVIVEINGQIHSIGTYGAVILKDQDILEIVHFIGGGNSAIIGL